MVDAGARGRGDDRLGVEGDAQPGLLSIARSLAPSPTASAAASCSLAPPPAPAVSRAWRRGPGSARPPRRLAAVAVVEQHIGAVDMKPSTSATRPVKKVKPPETSAVVASCARIVATSSRAPGVSRVCAQVFSSASEPQPFQHRDPQAQRLAKIDLAVHAAPRDRRDLRLEPGICGEFVQRLAGDDGAVHVGEQQPLAPAARRRRDRVDRRALQRRRARRRVGRRGAGDVGGLARRKDYRSAPPPIASRTRAIMAAERVAALRSAIRVRTWTWRPYAAGPDPGSGAKRGRAPRGSDRRRADRQRQIGAGAALAERSAGSSSTPTRCSSTASFAC